MHNSTKYKKLNNSILSLKVQFELTNHIVARLFSHLTTLRICQSKIHKLYQVNLSQLIKSATRYCIQQNEKSNGYLNSQIEKNWKKSITNGLDEAKSYYLSKLISQYKIESELENKVWNIVERYEKISAIGQIISKKFEDEVYECLSQIKKTFLHNDCFIVLNESILRRLNSNYYKLL